MGAGVGCAKGPNSGDFVHIVGWNTKAGPCVGGALGNYSCSGEEKYSRDNRGRPRRFVDGIKDDYSNYKERQFMNNC